jgi:hypothetical protein
MNQQDKIMKLAKSCGVVINDMSLAHESIVKNCYLFPTTNHLEAFANLIRADENESLRNQLAECQKDAERYRWLMNDSDGNKQDDLFQWMAGNVFSRSYIDKAIDQAMSEKGYAMSFDDIPENQNNSVPCPKCISGNAVEDKQGNWSCDTCDWCFVKGDIEHTEGLTHD